MIITYGVKNVEELGRSGVVKWEFDYRVRMTCGVTWSGKLEENRERKGKGGGVGERRPCRWKK